MAGDAQATHFLGAVVLQHQANHVGALAIRTIIDGQQRLTTLQLLLDAVHGQMESRGYAALARQLKDLVQNADHFRQQDEDRYKVWPTNRDRKAFNEVMSAPNPCDHGALADSTSRLVKAHKYFSETVHSWLEQGDAPTRASHLVSTITTQLQLVAIELQYDEDAQEIFETLNARGTPLTPADLIKNFVFQRLDVSPDETELAYRTYWADFETPFWERKVSSGRVIYSRSSLFLNHWLVATTLHDVPAREVFAQFKNYVTDGTLPMAHILPVLRGSADKYRTMLETASNSTASLTRREMFVYRTSNLDSEIVKPLLIWLAAAEQADIPTVQADKALSVIESWLVRRSLVRAKTQGTNRFIVDLLVHMSKQSHDHIGDAVQEFLAGQNGPISYWPDDAEVRRELTSLQIYRRLRRGRLRMVLEAIEDNARGWDSPRTAHEQRVIRDVCTIEHIMPQEWRRHWAGDIAPEQEGERDRAVHTLGNLTLVTQSLNSKVSNAAWQVKRAALNNHTSILLTREVHDSAPDSWAEESIQARTASMIARILRIWPVPNGHTAQAEHNVERGVARVELADLVRTGLVMAGAILYARPQAHKNRTCSVSEDGRLFVDGAPYETPSGAAKAVTRSQGEPGWWFWLTEFGGARSLSDLRREYLEGFDDALEDNSDED